MKDIEISRDKKNPTWVWVWNNEKPKQFKEEDKVILLDVFESLNAEWDASCLCVEPNKENEENYKNNRVYNTRYFKHYQITEKPTFRPIETLEDYIEATKKRKDLRVIAKDGTFIINLRYGDFDRVNNKMFFRGYDGKYIFENCVWIDDRSPVGVKCL